MKPYIEIKGKKVYLPQQVDPHRFEVCALQFKGTIHYLLCPKLKNRYRQATGIHIEQNGNEFAIPMVNGKVVKRTFPLEGMETIAIQIDWSAGNNRVFTSEADETTAE